MPIAATDFCLSRAERVWDVICAIWDLLRCREIFKSALTQFSTCREICSAHFLVVFPSCFSSSPELLLGSGICCLRARRLGRGAWFVGCSWHTVPSWSAANEVQDMLRLRARAAARPVQGMRRQQQLLRAPAAALLLQLQGVWWQQLLCEHRRQRSQCKECGRSSFCEHGRPRDYCNCRVRWQQHLRARAAVHHLHEGVQWQCHSQAQAAAWPLRAQAAAQVAAQLVQDRCGGSIFSVEAAEADKSSTGTRGGLTRHS